jgi:RNA polymerase sigma factor (TIGR02999 family)
METSMSQITLVLEAICRGEKPASEELLPLVYDELRRLASAQMAGESAGQTLQATALVHEAWLRLVKEENRTWNNREHFFRAAAQAMRRILVERARQRLSLKRGAGAERVPLEDIDVAAATTDDRVLLVNQSLERLEKEDPEIARIVMLKFFAGLTTKEAAAVLKMPERTLERQWAYARACLFDLMQEEEAGQ